MIRGLGPDFCARKQVYVSYRTEAVWLKEIKQTYSGLLCLVRPRLQMHSCYLPRLLFK
jgi:hypothetical protein